MVAPKEIKKGLWTFQIEMPDNPLKWLNCYVVKGVNGGRNLLVDTGFKTPECRASLLEGIEAMGLDMKNTDVFLTHHHADHTGNAQLLESMGARLFMSRDEYLVWQFSYERDHEEFYSSVLKEGAPYEVAFYYAKPENWLSDDAMPEHCNVLDKGDVLRYGDYCFECIYTRGHTPGHMSLYDRENKVIILGDHVLFDVTPNIGASPMMVNCLEVYMNNLRKVSALPVELALPAHRQQGEVSLADRANRLIAHHERRLAEMEQLIAEAEEGLSAYELARRSRWKIRAASWEEFPIPQKWFALQETLAHLVYLVDHGRVVKRYENDLNIYSIKK